MKTLESLGYDLTGINHDFRKPTHLRIGEAPMTIDILNETKGLNFKTVFKNAGEGYPY